MALIKTVRGFTPEIDDSCWLADNVTIIGEVKLRKNCTVWFGAIVRGDVNSFKAVSGVSTRLLLNQGGVGVSTRLLPKLIMSQIKSI